MEWQITGRGVEITEAVRHYVQGKIGRLGRHLPNITESKVEIARERTRAPQHRFVAQVTIDTGGTVLRGEERGEELYPTIDRVADIMDRQIERYKGKLYEKGRGTSLNKTEFASEETERPGRVVKVKRFTVKPMSVDEAIEQMEFLGHDFLLFLDADNEKLNLLYRRRDADYGLIEPE